jgi:hypothetical protein
LFDIFSSIVGLPLTKQRKLDIILEEEKTDRKPKEGWTGGHCGCVLLIFSFT